MSIPFHTLPAAVISFMDGVDLDEVLSTCPGDTRAPVPEERTVPHYEDLLEFLAWSVCVGGEDTLVDQQRGFVEMPEAPASKHLLDAALALSALRSFSPVVDGRFVSGEELQTMPVVGYPEEWTIEVSRSFEGKEPSPGDVSDLRTSPAVRDLVDELLTESLRENE